jgi:hypothetical protein
MMRCSDVQNQLGMFIDGELSKEVRAKFRSHLRDCSECRSEYEKLVRINKFMQKSPQSSPKAEYWKTFPGRVLQQLPVQTARQSQKNSTYWAFTFRIAGVAAVCVVMLFVVKNVLWNSKEQLSSLPNAPAVTIQSEQKELERQTENSQIILREEIGSSDKRGRDKGAELKPPSGVTIVAKKDQVVVDKLEMNKPAPNQWEDQEQSATASSNMVISGRKNEVMVQAAGGNVGTPTISNASVVGHDVALTRSGEATIVAPSEEKSKELLLSLADTLKALQRIADEYNFKIENRVADGFTSDLKTRQESDASRSTIITVIATYYHNLIKVNQLDSLRPEALLFFETHKQVLSNSLGNEVYQQFRADIEKDRPKP